MIGERKEVEKLVEGWHYNWGGLNWNMEEEPPKDFMNVFVDGIMGLIEKDREEQGLSKDQKEGRVEK